MTRKVSRQASSLPGARWSVGPALALLTTAATAGTISVTAVNGSTHVAGTATDGGISDTFEEFGSLSALGESSHIEGSAAQGNASASADADMQTSAISGGFPASYDRTGPGGEILSGNHGSSPVDFEGDVPAGAYTLHTLAGGSPPGLPAGGHASAFAQWSFEIRTAPVHNITQGTDWPTIQSAVINAVDGDELRVDPGLYTENVDLGTRNLLIVGSSGDPASVVIDGAGVLPVVVIGGGQTIEGTRLEALTMIHGFAAQGAGVRIVQSGAQIVNCVISTNHATGAGGGVAVIDSPGVNIIGCRIEDNSTPGEGGGIFIVDSAVFLNGSTISGNSANGGGAVYMAGALLLNEYCTYENNEANFSGSAILNQGGDLQLNSCLFDHNTAGSNTVGVEFDANAVITNASFADNVGGQQGGIGIFQSTVLVSNSIFWGDTMPEISPTAEATVNHCIVQGGWTGPGTGNRSVDPMFVDAANRDYHVLDGSPALDAGENGAPRVLFHDLDFGPRIRHCRVDIGAFESPFFADCNDNGIGDGCDVAPIVDPGFEGDIGVWEGIFDGGVLGLGGGIAITISAHSPPGDGDHRTGWSHAIPAGAATVTFVLLSYESDDDGRCPGGSPDFPIFVANDQVFPLNQDGTLAPALTDHTDCLQAGTITNDAPPPAPVTCVVDLVSLVGPGPYVVGVGVATVDSTGGPGTAIYDSLNATTDIRDTNGNGIPDACDCPGDLDQSGEVSITDLLILLGAWGSGNPAADVNGDGVVNITDLLELIGHWGLCG